MTITAPTPITGTNRPSTDDTDDNLVAHYAKKDDVTRAYIEGCAIVALCGKTFIPTRDPLRYPVCQECKALKDMGLTIG